MPPRIGPVDVLDTSPDNDFLAPLFEARLPFFEQQAELLRDMAPTARRAILGAVPELSRTVRQLERTARRGLTRREAEEVGSRIRVAQIARGFEGGTAPATAEAQALTQIAQQRRGEAAQQLMGIEQGILDVAGLAEPLGADIGTLGQLFQGQQQLAALQAAGQAQSEFSRKLFKRLFERSGGNVNVIVGRGAAGGRGVVVGSRGVGSGRPTFDASGRPISGGQGLEFGSPPPATGGGFNTPPPGAPEAFVINSEDFIPGGGGLTQTTQQTLLKVLRMNKESNRLTPQGERALKALESGSFDPADFRPPPGAITLG